MIRATFTIQCDVCGDLFEQLRICDKPISLSNQWALNAGTLLEAAGEDGWYFNSKTRKHWCADCLIDLPPPNGNNN